VFMALSCISLKSIETLHFVPGPFESAAGPMLPLA
jgi:hypothetical protein